MNIRIKTKYLDEEVSLECEIYSADPDLKAVRIDGRDPKTGEPVLTLTTFLPDNLEWYGKDLVVIKSYSENEGIAAALVAAKIGIPALSGSLDGFVPFRITAPGLLILMEDARDRAQEEVLRQKQ